MCVYISFGQWITLKIWVYSREAEVCNHDCTSTQKELSVDLIFLTESQILPFFGCRLSVSVSSVISSDMILCSNSSYILHHCIIFFYDGMQPVWQPWWNSGTYYCMLVCKPDTGGWIQLLALDYLQYYYMCSIIMILLFTYHSYCQYWYILTPLIIIRYHFCLIINDNTALQLVTVLNTVLLYKDKHLVLCV